MSRSLYIGLMSGTSLDGIDAVLVDFAPSPWRVRAHRHAPFPSDLRSELLTLNTPGPDELHRAALAANALARQYAALVSAVLLDAGTAADAVCAIGAHGQTVRHRPREFDGTGYTLQLNQPALLAELAGIDVVSDFRSRDVAAGGQAAPLVPAFHAAVFARPGEDVAVLNLGGIGNLTLLGADGSVRGFDCGPGNALLDFWCERHTGHAYDDAGAWGADGQVLPALLDTLLAEPFLAAAPPKSTGRDLFNPSWLARHLGGEASSAAPQDVQATLAEFSARAAVDALKRHAPRTSELLVCGGGSLNADLMSRLQRLLPATVVRPSSDRGLPPMQVEAVAFAWLARAFVERQPGNRPEVTGASGPRVLGALYPAG